MDDTGLEPLKKLFAARLLQVDLANPQEVFKVAIEFAPPGDLGKALWIQQHWPNDEIVLAEKVRLVQEGFVVDDKENVKKKLIERLMVIVESPKSWNEDVIKAAKEVASIIGITDENKLVINNNQTFVTNKVMVVKDHGSDEDWETKAIRQQERLTDESAERVIN